MQFHHQTTIKGMNRGTQKEWFFLQLFQMQRYITTFISHTPLLTLSTINIFLQIASIQKADRRPPILPFPILPTESEYDFTHDTWTTTATATPTPDEELEHQQDLRREERRAQKLAAYHSTQKIN